MPAAECHSSRSLLQELLPQIFFRIPSKFSFGIPSKSSLLGSFRSLFRKFWKSLRSFFWDFFISSFWVASFCKFCFLWSHQGVLRSILPFVNSCWRNYRRNSCRSFSLGFLNDFLLVFLFLKILPSGIHQGFFSGIPPFENGFFCGSSRVPYAFFVDASVILSYAPYGNSQEVFFNRIPHVTSI